MKKTWMKPVAEKLNVRSTMELPQDDRGGDFWAPVGGDAGTDAVSMGEDNSYV